MAGRKLTTTVFVHNEDGTSTAYGPDDVVPAEVEKKITNPAVWAEDEKPAPKSGK